MNRRGLLATASAAIVGLFCQRKSSGETMLIPRHLLQEVDDDEMETHLLGVKHTPPASWPFEFPQGKTDLALGKKVRECCFEWDFEDERLWDELVHRKQMPFVFIDGRMVKHVVWCNVRTGLAELHVKDVAGIPLFAPGNRDFAKVVVDGEIEVKLEHCDWKPKRCRACGKEFDRRGGATLYRNDGTRVLGCNECFKKRYSDLNALDGEAGDQ